jgi:hypothetical protein
MPKNSAATTQYDQCADGWLSVLNVLVNVDNLRCTCYDTRIVISDDPTRPIRHLLVLAGRVLGGFMYIAQSRKNGGTPPIGTASRWWRGINVESVHLWRYSTTE